MPRGIIHTTVGVPFDQVTCLEKLMMEVGIVPSGQVVWHLMLSPDFCLEEQQSKDCSTFELVRPVDLDFKSGSSSPQVLVAMLGYP